MDVTHLLKYIKQAILVWSFRQNILPGCYREKTSKIGRAVDIVVWSLLYGDKCHAAAVQSAAAALYTAKLESGTKTVSAINFHKSINSVFCVLPGHEVSVLSIS